MELNLNAFLEEFRDEAGEHLRALDAQLLALERDPGDPAPIRAMFLAAHSLKGAGGMMDLADVEALAHAAEDVLARLRDGQQRLDAATADCLFRAFDLLGERVARAAPGAAPVDAPVVALIESLSRLDGGTGPADGAVSLASSAGPPAIDARPVALLIEDSATVRLLHAALLAESGCAVDVATDAQEALAMLGTRRYDLVVSERELPGQGGVAIAAALHERTGAAMPPFILMHNDDPDSAGATEPCIAAQQRTEPYARQRLSDMARDLLGQAARR